MRWSCLPILGALISSPISWLLRSYHRSQARSLRSTYALIETPGRESAGWTAFCMCLVGSVAEKPEQKVLCAV